MDINKLRTNINNSSVWISPEGTFYDGEGHDACAEEILESVYGISLDYLTSSDIGDKLESLGWIKASNGIMHESRLKDNYYKLHDITQSQYNALYSYCECHEIAIPIEITIK